ncbi:glycosyltransferase [Metabacillus idriensis]|uniref:glycosyltransferase n=1 Tax=Metabacillus idriensis TaxID=324768 RepID=UPI003D295DFE
MKKILLERSNKAYLPVIDAYMKYFNGNGYDFQMYDSSKLRDFHINDFDVLWKFMGFEAFPKNDIKIIHEYPSLSTGLLPKWKNEVKSRLNTKPDLRIFLNVFVKEGMNFKDNIEYIYRDMGVDNIFFNFQNSSKNYDCVYVGSISKERSIHILLDYFKYHCKNKNLLLIGAVQDDIYKNYSSCENIIFTGKLSYEDVPKYASQAVYGVNYMPDKYPFNIQTSTKLLEYLSMGLKVITTDYFWVNNFMIENDVEFIKVDEKLEGLENLLKYDERTSGTFINMEKYKWSNIIKQSLLEEKLKNSILH